MPDATPIAGGAAAALGGRIDGVARHEMAWVRSTTGEDVVQDAAGAVILTGHRQADTLAMLERWTATDGLDTSRVSPNFRNTVHGALNHHVGDHETGSWSGKGVVVVAQLDAMVAANGPPTSLNTVDTFWALGPDASLKVPGATVIRPDTNGALAPSDTSRRAGPGQVIYATTFEDGREATLLGRLSEEGQDHFADDVGRRLDGDRGAKGLAGHEAIATPRKSRSPAVAAAVDAELRELSKKAATWDVVRETGPVRQGSKWSWGDRDLTAETGALASFMGTRLQNHTGSDEDIAVNLMVSGQAASVGSLAGASSQTRASAVALAADPRYAAFALAKAVDRELAEAATEADGSGLSRPARQRLATMVERSVLGTPLPGIPELDWDGKATTRAWTPTAYDPAAPPTPEVRDKAMRGNARFGTLIRQALENETDPGLARRLEAAAKQTSASHAAMRASGVEAPVLPVAQAAPQSEAWRQGPPPIPRSASPAALPLAETAVYSASALPAPPADEEDDGEDMDYDSPAP